MDRDRIRKAEALVAEMLARAEEEQDLNRRAMAVTERMDALLREARRELEAAAE